MNVKSYLKEKKIVFIIFVLGIIMSFMMPTWQTPDEYTHLWMIGDSWGIPEFADKIEDSIGMDRTRILGNYEEKVDLDEQKDALTSKNTYTRKEMLPHQISLFCIKHFPAAIGLFVGILLGVPAYWSMQLAEFFCLLFYTLICYKALELMPVKKEILAIVMLFPMSIQQATGIGYDSVLIPLCFLFVAYIFYLKYDKDVVGLREVIFAGLLLLIITYIKIPYVLFGLLVFIIPLKKINIDCKVVKIDEDFIKRVRIPGVIVLGILIIGFCYIFRKNQWIQIVWGFIVEWKQGLYLLVMTGKTFTTFLMTSTIGNFGWLDTPISFFVVLLVFFFLAGISMIDYNQNERKVKKWDFFVVITTFVALCLFVTLGLTNHTIKVILFGSESSPESYYIREAMYQIPYIGGVQGRYYLPFVSLVYLILPQKIRISEKIVERAIIIFEIGLYVYVFWVLLQRYWIA